MHLQFEDAQKQLAYRPVGSPVSTILLSFCWASLAFSVGALMAVRNMCTVSFHRHDGIDTVSRAGPAFKLDREKKGFRS
jgi:hypothetical protein